MRSRYCFLSLLVFAASALSVWNTLAQEPEGLVLYLPFEEADNPVDHSPDPAEVSITGELSHVDVKIGKALEFDGDSANIVEVSHADKLEGMEALSIEAWVMPVEPDSKEGMSVVSKRAPGKMEMSTTCLDEIRASMEGRLKAVSVEPGAKLSATWGEIKRRTLR